MFQCPLCDGWGTYQDDPYWVDPGITVRRAGDGDLVNKHNWWQCEECGSGGYTNKSCAKWLYIHLQSME